MNLLRFISIPKEYPNHLTGREIEMIFHNEHKPFDVGERVWFLAYNDGREPVEGKVINKGTLPELGRHHISKDDDRIFYEVETLNEDKNFIFTVTMGRSLYKHNEKPIVNVCK